MLNLEPYPKQYHRALRILIPIWRGINPDYKSKYARSIWQQYEENVIAAAYTATASRFYSNLCSRLEIRIEPDVLADFQDALNVVTTEQRTLLRQLRDETATLVLMVRLDNEQRKAAWAERKIYEEGEDK